MTGLIWQLRRITNRIPGAYLVFSLVMRLFLRDGKVVRIPFGPIAGLKWRHYRRYQPWMALGLYEPPVSRLITSELPPGGVFWDIGANSGYFTLIGASCVGTSGSVVAFDPDPDNAATIQEQTELNGLAQRCSIEAIAISDVHEIVDFVIEERNANSHLSDVAVGHFRTAPLKTLRVQTMTLDDYLADGHELPCLVKMDIEGAEELALRGAAKALQAGLGEGTIWLISTHSTALQSGCRDLLEAAGYTVSTLESFGQMLIATPPLLAES